MTTLQFRIKELKERFDSNESELKGLRELAGELEQANSKLMESEKLKSHFLSNLKNELNNPLASLISLSRELIDVKDEVERDSISAMIYYESLSLDFQLKNILAAAELEAGGTKLRRTIVDVGMLIEDCLSSFIPMIKEKCLEVIKDFPEEGIHLNTDADKLYQIILNLLSNAVVFNRDYGRLIIRSEVADSRFIISVTDDGIGIAQEYHEMIFDRFRELYMGTTKKFKGHGLGLSVAKAMADHLDGEISVESRPAKGSKFTYTMPADLRQSGVDFGLARVELFPESISDVEF